MWGGPRLTASRRADRILCAKLRAHACLPCSTCGLLRSHWELVRDPPWARCLVNSHLCVPIPHERRASREEQSCVPHRAASLLSDIAPLFTQPACIECLFALRTLDTGGLRSILWFLPLELPWCFFSDLICKLYLYKTSDCQESSPQSLQRLYKLPKICRAVWKWIRAKT